MDIIGDVFLAFLLKENMPVEEAEDLVGKVREKKMGMLFENMVKMDIQEERRKTEEQRLRAEEAEQKAEDAIQKLEDSIRLFIESCQEFGIAKEEIVAKLAEKYQLELEEAGKMVEMYYKKE